MPASVPPVPHAQTLRQARAAYKARTSVQLSDVERRRLERSIELDRRACRIKEAEKRKTEAAKKRAEKDREEQAQSRLGSQRRCDKFGYKSSQMHLGAFLGKPKTAEVADQKAYTHMTSDESDEESFGDSGVDDETLLEALNDVPAKQTSINFEKPLKSSAPAPSGPHRLQQDDAPNILALKNDQFSMDDFCTSTQVARDLETDSPLQQTTEAQAQPPALGLDDDNEFDDFDMTADDLLELDVTTTTKKASQDRRLMPPPPLPAKRSTPPRPWVVEFTLHELEHYIDDDLQLTQVDPV